MNSWEHNLDLWSESLEVYAASFAFYLGRADRNNVLADAMVIHGTHILGIIVLGSEFYHAIHISQCVVYLFPQIIFRRTTESCF